MGLDITVYEIIKEASLDVIKAIEQAECRYEKAEDLGVNLPFDNTDFPGRMDGMRSVPHYAKAVGGFRAGSYGGYNAWRRSLAQLVGIQVIETWWAKVARSGPSCAQAVPFWQLLNFSDCEGSIGPVVSAELARDFDEWKERAMKHGDERWRELYLKWQEAFRLAANSGWVGFH